MNEVGTRVGGQRERSDEGVVEVAVHFLWTTTFPSAIDDVAIVGVAVGVATMWMVMTTSKTLMMAGMRGAFSLDTTNPIIILH